MNIFALIKKDIIELGKQIYDNQELLSLASVEIPKNPLNGDVATNIAMIIAPKLGKNSREIGLKFKDLFTSLPYVAHIEIAGSGFVNFTLRANVWHESIKEILSPEIDFTKINIGNNQKINIEYVSPNPTGPIHIGHARGAVYGDALARLLHTCGYNVTKECYFNDAGSQIDILTQSTILRYRQAMGDEAIEIPEGFYPGDYLIEVGQKLAHEFGNTLLLLPDNELHDKVKKITINEMIILIKNDLKDLGINHDVFFSEQSLHDSKAIDNVILKLKTENLIYEGKIPSPKGRIEENWQERMHTLFRSTTFGDSQDRPIQKADGSWSYLAPDIAYAEDKIDRGFTNLIYVLGADHLGYIKRIESVVKALGKDQVQCTVTICQTVNFVENGIPVKMSKRQGNFTTVSDVIKEVGKDILRFIMLTRKNDAVLDFDLALVKEQSKENPVFYAQYAYVRTISIIANAKEHLNAAYLVFANNKFDLSLLSSEEEIQIIRLLASWPKVLESAAISYEPHRIAFYILGLAAKFHSLWNLGKENNDYRFIIEDDIELTASRLALTKSIQKIIASGFDIIGIEPLDKM
ncbi:MAG: arginine--tRNA ligase [Rickettsiaceae bacterium]|nr:MAG: arginine--tRNA ligase [Rickettsiaceae bacterium]